MNFDYETYKFIIKAMKAIDHSLIHAFGSFYSPKEYDKTMIEYLKDARRKINALIERMNDDKKNG